MEMGSDCLVGALAKGLERDSEKLEEEIPAYLSLLGEQGKRSSYRKLPQGGKA